KAFAKSLSEGLEIDRAVAVARQSLLTLYKFNQPAWTLPVLYMHPEFDGQLVELVEDVVTQLPTNSPTRLGHSLSRAYLRLAGSDTDAWPLWAGMLRVGRWPDNNDVVVQERWVSQKHAEIFSRNSMPEMGSEPTYFLRDFSRYGTLISESGDWQRIHREEVALRSGTLLKFGSSQGQAFEFIIETVSSFGK
ncbi:MAG: FHA domain-containing protein, partial [Okeania sp. SIO2H7]|nr:FHA domain-containing protein [Okeania sp. SIO2H7]